MRRVPLAPIPTFSIHPYPLPNPSPAPMNKTQSLNNLAILEDLGEVKSTPSINNAINVSDHNSDGYLVGFDFEDEDGSSTKIVSLNDIPKPPPNPKPPPKPLVESSTPPQIFQPSSPFKPLKRSTSFSSLKSSKLSRSSSFNSLAMLSKSAPISRSVSFAKINIREHSQVLGDHPSCSRGPPVSLGWEVEREWEGDLDAWEGQREGERRDRRAMHMDASEREELVLENGANVSDITRTTENIKRGERALLMAYIPLLITNSIPLISFDSPCSCSCSCSLAQ